MPKAPDRVVVPSSPAPANAVEREESPTVTSVTELASAAEPSANVTVTQLSELDSYILQRQREQPKDLEGVARRVEVLERKSRQRHRLTLPEFFEQRSYDNVEAPGAYIFRWLFKEKRAIDRALNVLGWTLVNRTYFPQAPRYLFTANGGVEIGDAILAFMPAKRALEIRAEPAQKSQDRLKARTTQVEKDYVLMTGNPKDDRVYKPEMGSEEAEEAAVGTKGEMVEGRDF